MSIQNIDKALNLIEENGGDFEGPKDNVIVFKAERALGLTFPPTYKKFLLTLGCGDIDGLEFYGIVSEDFENSAVPDAIWLTLNERKVGLPSSLIIVCASGDGIYYAIDRSHVNDAGESPVVAYSAGGTSKTIAEDFGSFLLNELNMVLE